MGFLGWRRATDEIWLGPLNSWFHPPDSEQLPAIDRSGRHDGPEAGAVASGAPGVSVSAKKVESEVHTLGTVGVESGAPAVQADATKVGVGQPRDTAGAVQSGAPGVAARAQTVPADAAVVHEVSADVVSGAPSVAADADRIEAGQADAAATAGAGVVYINAHYRTHAATPLPGRFSDANRHLSPVAGLSLTGIAGGLSRFSDGER